MNKKTESIEAIKEAITPYRSFIKIAHHIPGRIRLKASLGSLLQLLKQTTDNSLPSLKQIEEELIPIVEEINGVTEVRFNVKAGTVVICYDQTVVPPQLLIDLFVGSQQQFEQALFTLDFA